MEIKKYRLIHTTPSHYVMHNGITTFHIAKTGLNKELTEKIQGMADGGPVGPGGIPLDPAKAKAVADAFKNKGGEIKHYDEGGKISDNYGKSLADTAANSSDLAGSKPNAQKSFSDNFKFKGGKVGAVQAEGPRQRRDGPIGVGGAEAAHMERGGKIDHNQKQVMAYSNGGKIDHNNQVTGTKTLNTNAEHAFLRDWINKHVVPKQNFDDGGEVPQSDNDSDSTDNSMKEMQDQGESYQKFLDDFKEFQKQHYALGTEDVEPAPAEEVSAPVETPEPGAGVSTQDPNVSPADAAFPEPKPDYSQAPDQTPVNQAPAPEQPSAVAATAPEETPIPKQEVPKGPPSTDQQLQDLATQYSKLASDRAKSDSKFLQSVQNNPIDAHRLMNSMTTGQKLSTGIGLILGGIFSGVSGQANPAMHMLNQAINNDIEAQKTNQSNRQSLWKMNHEAFGDQMAANLATRNNMLDIAKFKIDEQMGTMPGPMAQARADALKTQIDLEKKQNNNGIAMIDFRQKLLAEQDSMPTGKLSARDPATLVPIMIQSPELQKIAYKEIEDRQNIIHDKPKLMAALNQAIADKKAGKLSPSSIYNLHQLILPYFQEKDGTVRQAAMQETFNNVTPALFDSHTKDLGRNKALNDWINSKMSTPVSNGNNINLDKYESTHSTDLAPNINKKVDIFMRQNPDTVKTPDQAIRILKQHGKL